MPESGLDDDSLHRRDDLATVDLERLLLVAVHQVDVELVDTGVGQFGQLAPVVVDRSDDAEAVDHLVGHELCIGRADLRVMQVVVSRPVANVTGQRRRQLGRVVATEEVYDVVADQGREPPHPVTAVGQVAYVCRRRGHDSDVLRVPARYAGRVTQLADEPPDQVRFGQDRKSTRLNSSHGYISY